MELKPPSPKIRAQFVLDQMGNPISEEAGGRKHYKIQLFTEPLSTALVDTVIYDLHSSYYDPKREVNVDPGRAEYEFPEEISSYGDFVVKAAVSGSAGQAWNSRDLADALDESYRQNENPEIRRALDDIRSH